MSALMVILLVLFILCNGIWMAAIVAASRADRVRVQPPNRENPVGELRDPVQERDDVTVKSRRLVRKTS